ncbi:MAG: guanylate kinase [Chloroflexi bacterium]|nr:guanylate kinase [Chloroflexota bacterium]
MIDSRANPLLIVISGPSGVGKDAVLNGMKKRRYPLYYAVTATTRPRRERERDGVDYYFVSRVDFEKMIAKNELLEWANVYGNLYGVPKRQIQEALGRGQDAVIKVDVQGAAAIKKIIPQAVFIFLAPPSMNDLENRLRRRRTESGVDLELRMKAAQEEMKQLPMFDYVVVNHKDGIEAAISQIEAIITAERRRVNQRLTKFENNSGQI